jgi:hypothetical protein
MMIWYENITDDAKVAYVLSLTEEIAEQTKDYEWYRLIRRLLKMCWEWVEEKKHSADDIYYEFDDEDDAMVYIECYPEVKSNPQLKYLCFCIFDGFCYAIWKAYQYEGEKSVPQYFESESDLSIQEFTEKITKIDGCQAEWAERLKEYLLKNHPAGSDKKIQREELLKLIA